MLLWVKNSVCWARSALLHGTYCMLYLINLQICNYAQKRRICRKNSKYAPDENYCGHFCPRRKAANFCHPVFSQTRTVVDEDMWLQRLLLLGWASPVLVIVPYVIFRWYLCLYPYLYLSFWLDEPNRHLSISWYHDTCIIPNHLNYPCHLQYPFKHSSMLVFLLWNIS